MFSLSACIERARDSYSFAYEPNEASKDLLIICSHTPQQTFKSVQFPYNILRIADRTNSYYTADAGHLKEGVLKIAKGLNFCRVIFFGASKGGFGALSLAGSMVEHGFTGPVISVVFSPQTQIYPNNPAFTFPSYKQLIAQSAEDPKILADLQSNGSLSTSLSQPNVRILCVHGKQNSIDVREAARLPANTTHYELDMYNHLTVVPFMCDVSSEAALEETLFMLYSRAQKDSDLNDLLGPQLAQQFRDELARLPVQPRLFDFVTNFVGAAEELEPAVSG